MDLTPSDPQLPKPRRKIGFTQSVNSAVSRFVDENRLKAAALPEAVAALAADPASRKLQREVNRQVQRFVMWLMRQTLDYDDACSVAQDTSLKVLEALRHGQTVEHPQAWVKGIAYNERASLLRYKLRACRNPDQPNISLDELSSLEDLVAPQQEGATFAVLELLTMLPLEQQNVVRAMFLQGLNRAETAETLGLSESKVQRLRSEGLDALRAAMGQQ